MMVKTLLKVLVLVMAGALLFGCAAQQPLAPFKAQDLNPKLQSGEYVQKVDNFMLILDGSGSMSGAELGAMKEVASRMNQTIPDLKLMAGVRRFGLGDYGGGSPTALLYGIEPYTKEGVEGGIQQIRHGNGDSPMELAIQAASEDFKAVQGNIALIIISDGQEMDNAPVTAAMKMKTTYCERLCIYTVLIGNDPNGKTIMERVALAGQCGFASNAAALSTPEGMADFVEKVFLARVMKPAEPPKPAPPKPAVPMKPKDSDGDGVLDDKDKCPGTPMSAPVDADGCWMIRNVEFDTDKWDIKSRFEPVLDHVVAIMKKNPWLNMEIHGHADIRGTAAHNQALSERRAEAVKQYFINRGVSGDRLTTEGFSYNKPIASNTTEEGMARNRRSEVKVAR